MQWAFLVIMYLAGSIPFGLLIGFLAGKDVRTAGSGNIGFTNVLRVCGAHYGIPVLLLDWGKGTLPLLLLAPSMLHESAAPDLFNILGGLCAILGHNFPVWLKFRGGKGVAVSAGVMLALVPVPLLAGLITFLLILAITRYVSLGSMLGSFVLFITYLCITPEPFSSAHIPYTIFSGLVWLLIMLTHIKNIRRLLRGEENKIGRKATAHPAPEDAEPTPTATETPHE